MISEIYFISPGVKFLPLYIKDLKDVVKIRYCRFFKFNHWDYSHA